MEIAIDVFKKRRDLFLLRLITNYEDIFLFLSFNKTVKKYYYFILRLNIINRELKN